MNIWTFLGLPEDHRAEDKIVQLVRHHEDVIKKVTWPRIGQIKKDGVYSLVVVDDGRCAVFGRTGRELQSVQHLYPVARGMGGRVVYIAELCCDYCSLEALSGIVNPNRKKALDEQQRYCIERAYFTVHDMLYLSELVAGYSERSYTDRLLDLKRNMFKVVIPGGLIPSIIIPSEEASEEFSQRCILDGEEGAVFKDPEAGWLAGRKNEVATKKVKGVDFDLQVVGYEEGKGKHSGMVGKLLVRWVSYGAQGTCQGDYTALPIDGCFTQDMRREWFNDYHGTIHHKIVHVHALCIGSKGALRLPKIKTVRIDKSVADL